MLKRLDSIAIMSVKPATVTEAVKESLLGSDESAKLSAPVRAIFVANAKRDDDGELYMGPEEFIEAIAPSEEDYVSLPGRRHTEIGG